MRVAILGGGFMGGALAQGLVAAGRDPASIEIAEIRAERRDELADTLGVAVTGSARDAVAGADVVIFAVKPQVLAEVLADVAPAFGAGKLALSICAGARTETFEKVLGEVTVVRAMPNTPAAIGEGATAVAPGRFAGEDDVAVALDLLGAVGRTVTVDESQMDAVTAVSGSGPAYLFLLAEALLDAAQDQGLSAEQADTLVTQTLVGASRLLSRDSAGPAELRARVTSPGGTTQAAIETLEAGGFRELVAKAVAAARRRAEDLA